MADSEDDDLLLGTTTAQPEPDQTETVEAQAPVDEAEHNSDSGSMEAVEAEGEANAVDTVDTSTELAAYLSMSKEEAKSSLSEHEYKKWKKAVKRQGGGDKSEKKDKKKEKKQKKEKKEKESSSKEKKKKRHSGTKRERQEEDAPGAEEFYGAGADPMQHEMVAVDHAAVPTKRRRGQDATAQAKTSSAAAKKKMAQDAAREQVTNLILDMKAAHDADIEARKKSLPPLHRRALLPRVSLLCKRHHLHELLIQNGFLDLISGWIADRRRKELGPLDLRVAAVDLLLEEFPYEGVRSTQRTAKKARVASFGSENIEEDVSWQGITPEELERAPNLGWAVNFMRKHKDETANNQNKCARLLELLSRAFNGGDDTIERSDQKRELWASFEDRGVAPPFVPLKTRSEVFQKRSTKVDPLDPTSYLRQPPLRVPAAFVTAIFPDEVLAHVPELSDKPEARSNKKKPAERETTSQVLSSDDDE